MRAGCTILLALLGAGSAHGDPLVFREGFNGSETIWRFDGSAPPPTLVAHSRTSRATHDGGPAEEFVFSTPELEPAQKLVLSVPPALVFDEVIAALWVQSNRTGVRLGVRIRFPHQIDPRTRQPLSMDLLGDPYSTAGPWQLLRCQTSDRTMDEQLLRLRNQIVRWTGRPDLDTREPYIDAVIIQLELQPGTTRLVVDELSLGPVVSPANAAVAGTAAGGDAAGENPRFTIRDDQMLLDGRPFLPLITAYHGEGVDELAACGFNVVWIARYDDTPLLTALAGAGLFAMAEPPRAPGEGAAVEPAGAVGLLPLTEHTAQVLLWNLGTRIPPGQLRDKVEWIDLVREADHHRARPVVLDVTGAEREFHRHVDLLGSSRHILHTSTAPREYLELLLARKSLALQNKPSLTHIQTEPAGANRLTRGEGQAEPVVEPEQIWMQSLAALSAGYKAISYWKTESVTGNAPAANETRLAITLCNMQVRLLEPWLASGKVVDIVPASMNGGTPVPARKRAAAADSDIQVAIIRSRDCTLLLPVWHESGAQFQPGAMFAGEVSFLIPPVGDNARAWEVTTTGVSALPQTHYARVAGATRIRLTDFDQFTAVLLTPDQASVESIWRQVQAVRQEAARHWIDLAAAKLARVTTVHTELEQLAPPVRNATAALADARRRIEQAETEFARGSYDEARRISRYALRATRAVQRRHWENAASPLASGVSSPHTICFQTLPDHWRMVAAIGARRASDENLLRSGEFEDPDTVLAGGWDHVQTDARGVSAYSQLYGHAAQGKYCLRLVAEPLNPSLPVAELPDAAIQWISPPIDVYTGQIVLITGKVQLEQPVTGGADGLMIYESVKGTVGALRWKQPTDGGKWQPFQLIREIHQSGPLRVSLELRGLGDVRIDDLRVTAINPD